MSTRLGARRSLSRAAGVLALALPLSGTVLAVSAPAALASGSITSPSSGQVISSGSSFTASATVNARSAATKMTLTGPAGFSQSKSASTSLVSDQALTIPVTTNDGTSVRNGSWTVTLSGGASGSRTFYTDFGTQAPTGFAAQGSGARDVAFTWSPNSEPDLSDYVLYDESGTQLADVDAATACTGSTCSYDYYYAADAPGTHSYGLTAVRPGGGCPDCPATHESDRATSSATLTAAAPSPTPTPGPSGSPAPGGASGGGTSADSGGTTSGGTTSGGSGSGGTGGSGGATKPGAKPTLPALADPVQAQRRAFALTFSAFAPSLNIPKLPPLPATSLPSFGSQPLPLGTYKPTLPYRPQTETTKTTSVLSEPLAAVRSLDAAQLAKSIALALILLLVGAHLRRFLGSHSEE
ncbi:MAG: hypothetical protein WCD35_04680 [Mycobacteriales bacterium]